MIFLRTFRYSIFSIALMALSSCGDKIKFALEFPIYSHSEQFIIDVLFNQYDSLEISNQSKTFLSKAVLKNRFGMDSIVTRSNNNGTDELIEVIDYLEKSDNCDKFKSFRLNYGVFKRDEVVTSQCFDRNGNIYSSCIDDYCERFKYFSQGEKITRKSQKSGVVQEFTFNEINNVIGIITSDSVQIDIQYNLASNLKLISRSDKNSKNSYTFFYKSGKLDKIEERNLSNNMLKVYKLEYNLDHIILNYQGNKVKVYNPKLSEIVV